MIQNGKYMKTLLHLASELKVTILRMISSPITGSSVQRSDCLQHLLQKICRKNLWASKSIKQDVRNLETTTKINLAQPESQLKQHLETLPKALQGAPRLRPSLPMNSRWSKCHRTGRSCSLRKWLLRPSKCCGFLPQRLENLHFYSIKIIRIGKYCSTWQVHWKSKFSARYQHRFFRAAIRLLAISSLKDLYKESLSKQIHQKGCTHPETTTTMNLPQPQSQLKQHLETLPKALQGAPRLRPQPKNSWWSKFHRTGRSCSLRKWLLRPSKCCGFLAKSLEKPSLL